MSFSTLGGKELDVKGVENVRNHRALRAWDTLALVIVLVALTAFLVMTFDTKGEYVEVYDDGKLVFASNINENSTFTIDGKLTVTIDVNGVKVVDPTCKDKLCEHQGYIKSGSIVCLPNKITVVVKGGGDVDAVS